MRSKYLVIFVLGLSVVNQIDAQENEAIENIIVSASKNEQKLEDVITSALVINESEIAESGFRSVSDLLHSLGGINVSQNGGWSTHIDIYARIKQQSRSCFGRWCRYQ